MEANQNKKYLFQVKHFNHVNSEWKLSHSGEMSHLDDMSHLHCVKIVQILNLCIQSEYGKIRTRKKLLIWILFTQCSYEQPLCLVSPGSTNICECLVTVVFVFKCEWLKFDQKKSSFYLANTNTGRED